ncbi:MULTISPECIES: SRPBCC family protein [unclassified Streptomyces]|uniref:SRPBCC family protein n=1 Tax=unclassified Streptomyces TaxID=2593676 RepID=UPI0001C1A83F|nr:MULTISPECIES: SRPBCC family protein [unclassified Streptomyces]AEN10654.1 Polyketide cyclase/dehydrase [Streptomyces sp. SirexAA-E]MYR65603.1 SRPBCC family protein [Streptomyces sp. SID4939]MYS00246.1 SRPBCC family protein [Streptomyces sp. SID4940]MYT62158.1 SRPBCC family protein [Streptomyces sp. SID8357]MYT84046.1 SRPBCC family protein [Streptomyces sp. SID8360]
MKTPGTASLHLSTHIDRTAEEVYAYASDPSHLPEWAAGLAGSVEETDGRWIADSPMGQVVVAFAPRNDFGVLDHDVTLPSGEKVHNPVRVIADTTGCEVVFTLRRRPEMSDEDFGRDADAVTADLAALKRALEKG